MVSAHQAILYKSVVFLMLWFILVAYQTSNQLRQDILLEQKKFNLRLSELHYSAKILQQQKTIEQSALTHGANIMFEGRSNKDGVYNGNRTGKGGY